jgi:hemolysin activation/secretion protein
LIHLAIRPALTLVSAAALLAGDAFAQTANSGTAARDPALSPPVTLPSGTLPPVAPLETRRAFVASDVQVKPADFKFSGNTLISSERLKQEIADSLGKSLTFTDLVDLAEKLKTLYRSQGYTLTDVFFPEQTFAKEGGSVEFAVVEARVGKWSVSVLPGAGISTAQAEAVVAAHYVRGTRIDQYLLDKPILLLRDLAGVDATVTVSPGQDVGEADVAVEVKPAGDRWVFSTSLDNFGLNETGEYRLGFNLTMNHPLGLGDQASLRLQPSSISGNYLYRLSYTVPVGPYGTKLVGSFSNSYYELGKSFTTVQPTGNAAIASLSVVHPMVRGRLNNVIGMVGVDHKRLNDVTAITPEVQKTIDSVRVGVLGLRTDSSVSPILGGGSTTYSAIATFGKARTSDVAAIDNTYGRFAKLNVDVERTQFVTSSLSLALGLSGQLASGNLQGAERYSFGGPSAVRGYGVSTGTADQGMLFTVEWRYRTAVELLGAPLVGSVFYDVARVQNRKFALNSIAPRFATFDSIGIGVKIGTEGKFVASASLAQRIGGPYPIGSDPVIPAANASAERKPQLWGSMNWWF